MQRMESQRIARRADSGVTMYAMIQSTSWTIAAAVAMLLWQPAPALPQTRAPAGAWVEARGARVHVPDGWSYNERLMAASGPLNMTNFGGAYASGGWLPPGGAEIEITSVPTPSNLVEYIKTELKTAKAAPLQEMAAGIRTSYVESVSPNASQKTVVTYVVHGGSLYKFYLSYWSGDRNESRLSAAYEQVIKEAQLR